MESSKPTACSFCGKSYKEVQKLIAGGDAYICDSCINVCKNILDKELAHDRQRERSKLNVSIHEVKDRIELLQQLRLDKALSENDYKSRVKKLLTQLDYMVSDHESDAPPVALDEIRGYLDILRKLRDEKILTDRDFQTRSKKFARLV